MRSIRRTFVAAALFMTMAATAATCALAADGPVIPKRTVNITLWRFGRYWPNPAAKEPQYKTWCWVPRLEFQVIGPVTGGSQWIVEFDKPDGKPWLRYNCRTDEVEDGALTTVKTPSIDDNKDEKKAVTAKTGVFPFRIRLKNELAGTNTVIFSGKYEINSYAPNQAIPDYKGKAEFFVEEEWRLPIGYIWLDPTGDDWAFPLRTQMWFRGKIDKLEAVLFKDGKQILDPVGSSEDAELKTGVGDPAHTWTLHNFQFLRVRSLVEGSEARNGFSGYFLNQNPGEYEIKVLRNNKLARSAKFTVGADGKIVDNEIASKNKLGGIRMVLPVKVVGEADGKYDALAWKTGALYGNPLAGFTAP